LAAYLLETALEHIQSQLAEQHTSASAAIHRQSPLQPSAMLNR
jgi:hypothetical protein